jgi:3-polyprenyl-4-hydroxybenzoate decarboxylase
MVLDATGRRGVGPGDARPAAAAPTARERELAGERAEQARAHRDVAARALSTRLPGVRDARVVEDVLLVLQVEGEERAGPALDAALADPVFAGLKLVAAVSDDVPLDDPTLLLWGIFTRFDAARDVRFAGSTLRGAWPQHRGLLAIDATWKHGYPEPVVMPEEIVRRVDARWGELFPGR